MVCCDKEKYLKNKPPPSSPGVQKLPISVRYLQLRILPKRRIMPNFHLHVCPSVTDMTQYSDHFDHSHHPDHFGQRVYSITQTQIFLLQNIALNNNSQKFVNKMSRTTSCTTCKKRISRARRQFTKLANKLS